MKIYFSITAQSDGCLKLIAARFKFRINLLPISFGRLHKLIFCEIPPESSSTIEHSLASRFIPPGICPAHWRHVIDVIACELNHKWVKIWALVTAFFICNRRCSLCAFLKYWCVHFWRHWLMCLQFIKQWIM